MNDMFRRMWERQTCYSLLNKNFFVYNRLKKIHERGLQSRELKRYYSKKPECLGTGSTFSSVGLSDIVAAFHILLIGMGFAVFVAFIEFLINKRIHKNVK